MLFVPHPSCFFAFLPSRSLVSIIAFPSSYPCYSDILLPSIPTYHSSTFLVFVFTPCCILTFEDFELQTFQRLVRSWTQENNLLLPVFQTSIILYYFLNLILIITNKCSYHSSSKKPTFGDLIRESTSLLQSLFLFRIFKVSPNISQRPFSCPFWSSHFIYFFPLLCSSDFLEH